MTEHAPRPPAANGRVAALGWQRDLRSAFDPTSKFCGAAEGPVELSVVGTNYAASMNSGPSPNDPANYPETRQPESRHPESQHLAARPILTTAEAADLLSVHVENLRKMVREGRIPAHRFPGGREIRFLRQELIDWVGQQPGHDRSPSVEQADASKDAP